MMRKRLLSLTLSAVMTLSLFPAHALAAETALPEEPLQLKGFRGNQYNPIEADAGILTVTADGTITGLDQSQLDSFDIKDITIPIPEKVSIGGITVAIHAIGEKAFYNKAYQEIVIPKT